MVIASNEWINYDDDQKQSQMIEPNVLTMAAPSLVQPSAVSAATAATVVVGSPNATINAISVGNNGATTILNSDSSECENLACDSLARIILICQPDSHPFQPRTILLAPNIECKVGRSIAKSKASDNNAIFDCKVLSRNHAVLWYSSDGKFYVKDTKSSNGTFINERKIPASEPVELNFGDVVKFGVEVMENSRKEVHGCIIASVKPYLPDGREAISISQLGRSSFRGDSRISFEELHRLNLYMQETSQREKLLKAKLQNIQNILDATRKNSSICWQSMIDEDRLLNRIDLLENKLQFLQKNSPADQLKEEILKLQDEKFLYQNSAKEALRKVYQERMDALQKLSKMERDYTCSENECSLLRDQIRYTKQNLQDVNSRLLRLETEYNEYKDQMEKCQRETNEEQSNFDAAAADLASKLKERELECEEYKKKIGELLLTRANELDAAEECKKEKYDENLVDSASTTSIPTIENNTSDSSTTTTLAGSIGPDESDGEGYRNNHEDDNNLAAKKSTIMKWLANSDLNQKEGSLDIMKAICNESDSSDDSDNNDLEDKCSTTAPSSSIASVQILSKLEIVARNLAQLEAVSSNGKLATTDLDADSSHNHLEDESRQLLKYSVELLRDILSDISKRDQILSQVGHPPTTKLQSQDTLVESDKYEDELIKQKQAIVDYQNEIQKLKILLEEKEVFSTQTLNSLQIECNSLKENISALTKDIENLRDEKNALEKVIAENKSNSAKSVIEDKQENEKEEKQQEQEQEENTFAVSVQADSFDKLIEEDILALNSSALMHEEELVLYKERFGRTQAENLKLKRDIAELKLRSEDFYNAILKKSLTYGVVVVALIVYFIFSYF